MAAAAWLLDIVSNVVVIGIVSAVVVRVLTHRFDRAIEALRANHQLALEDLRGSRRRQEAALARVNDVRSERLAELVEQIRAALLICREAQAAVFGQHPSGPNVAPKVLGAARDAVATANQFLRANAIYIDGGLVERVRDLLEATRDLLEELGEMAEYPERYIEAPPDLAELSDLAAELEDEFRQLVERPFENA